MQKRNGISKKRDCDCKVLNTYRIRLSRQVKVPALELAKRLKESRGKHSDVLGGFFCGRLCGIA